MFDPEMHPHRRRNPLTGEWVLVSPHRTQRPWQGQQERTARDVRPAYDANCYLCPGNPRAGGAVNPAYTSTFVFTNDFPALLPDMPTDATGIGGLLVAEPVRGTCRVVCFSPRHDLTLAGMPVDQVRLVVDAWAGQVAELGGSYRWVQVFENKGAAMGCSNPHPHGQVWAGSWLPQLAALEDSHQREYADSHGRPLLADYVDSEIGAGSRVVVQNGSWVVLVPYWAVWPFEVMVLPRRTVLRLPDLDDAERDALAEILHRLLLRYDALFDTSFPYSMGWHGAPFDCGRSDHWVLHAHFYPPLLRSASVRKFMVGYEMLAEPQRDLTAEQAAARLRAVPEAHHEASAQAS